MIDEQPTQCVKSWLTLGDTHTHTHTHRIQWQGMNPVWGDAIGLAATKRSLMVYDSVFCLGEAGRQAGCRRSSINPWHTRNTSIIPTRGGRIGPLCRKTLWGQDVVQAQAQAYGVPWLFSTTYTAYQCRLLPFLCLIYQKGYVKTVLSLLYINEVRYIQQYCCCVVGVVDWHVLYNLCSSLSLSHILFSFSFLLSFLFVYLSIYL